jgi:hypothetical protein
MISTPGEVIQELNAIRERSEKGLNLLESLERSLVTAELEADKIEAQAVLSGSGTVVDRQALSKLASIDAREKALLIKVQVNRAKAQLRLLSESMGAVQTSSRMIELEWRVGGTGR